MMKKILIISVTILGIVLAIVGGYYAVELVKLMGSNLLTVICQIIYVAGCYLISFLIVFTLSEEYNTIRKNLGKQNKPKQRR